MKGLSFIPTWKTGKNKQHALWTQTTEYHRCLKLTAHFKPAADQAPRTLFTQRSDWEPQDNQLPREILTLITMDRKGVENLACNLFEDPSNLTPEEEQAIQSLRENEDIIIKPVDKGSVTVIMDKEQYVGEADRQLNTTTYYKELNKPIYIESRDRILLIFEKFKKRGGGYFNKIQRDYLAGQDTPRPRYFYLLPKIHKSPETWQIPHEVPPGRLIVSDYGSESSGIAEYIDSYLNPLSTRYKSYIRDTNNFISKIREIRLEEPLLLFSMDINSLYTNIETDQGLAAVQSCFEKYPDEERPDTALIELLRIS